jgi:hypothetical protein
MASEVVSSACAVPPGTVPGRGRAVPQWGCGRECGSPRPFDPPQERRGGPWRGAAVGRHRPQGRATRDTGREQRNQVGLAREIQGTVSDEGSSPR